MNPLLFRLHEFVVRWIRVRAYVSARATRTVLLCGLLVRRLTAVGQLRSLNDSRDWLVAMCAARRAHAHFAAENTRNGAGDNS